MRFPVGNTTHPLATARANRSAVIEAGNGEYLAGTPGQSVCKEPAVSQREVLVSRWTPSKVNGSRKDDDGKNDTGDRFPRSSWKLKLVEVSEASMFLREAKGAHKVLHVRICRVEANVLSTPNDN